MMRMYVPFGLAILIVFLGGCTPSASSRRPVSESRVADLRVRVDSLERRVERWKERSSLRHPNLDATLWSQTAVEYDAVARGAYRLAGVMLERALSDSGWTAAPGQAKRPASQYREKPPAVVLDVDETVLDNSAYQARLIADDERYDTQSWNAWCRERAADAVPGARAFTNRADSLGVEVIYLTNRDSVVEEATRDNLRALGFPVDDVPGAVLTQGERPGWESKPPRREWVAQRYRVLLLIGDNLGDFVAHPDTSVSVRQARYEEGKSFWGTRWIALPNPQYGSWEGALFNYDFGTSPWEQLRRKRQHLNPAREGSQ